MSGATPSVTVDSADPGSGRQLEPDPSASDFPGRPAPAAKRDADSGPSRFDGLYRAAYRQPLMFVAVAVASGVVLDASIGPPMICWFGWLPVAAGTVWWGPRSWRGWAAVLVFVPCGALRHAQQDAAFAAASPWEMLPAGETPGVVEGDIDRPPRLRPHPLADSVRGRDLPPWQTQFEMTLRRIRDGDRFRPISGRALVTVDGRRDDLRPGDRLRVFGTLEPFRPPSNPGEPDLREIYRRRGIHLRLHVDRGEQLRPLGAQSWHPGRPVASLATLSREALLRHCGEATGPLAVALVIGQRDFVPPETRDLLLETGTAHLLSVSGLHLAIVVLLAQAFGSLLRLPKGWHFVWIVAVAALYVAITGGRPPVVRAAILVGLVTLSYVLRRPAQPLNTLALAALLLIWVNAEHVFSVGVQLSFLAVATLLMGVPRVARTAAPSDPNGAALDTLLSDSAPRLSRWLRAAAGWVGRAIWYSGAVTVMALPLVWHQFHIVSPISVLTNVLVGPVMFLALASGVATVLAASVFDPLGTVPGMICHASLALIHEIIERAAAVPGGHFWLPSPPAWWVALFYVGLLLSLALSRCRFDLSGRWTRGIRFAWIAGWIAVAWVLATNPSPLPRGTVEATFIDVGHGTSVAVRTAPDEVWLYDCGRLGNESGSSRGIDQTLWSMGQTEIAAVFLSHADADHFNALPGVLRRFSVNRIVTPPGLFANPEPALAAVRAAIERAGVPVEELAAGAELPSRAGPLRVLHPARGNIAGSDNAKSLVIELRAGGKPLLLPGDLEPPGTEHLTRLPRRNPGGVLMAPHHGSLSADTGAILHWSRPRASVVSGGPRARRPQVAEMLAVGGASVHVTAESGAIRVRLDADGRLELRGWQTSPW